MPSKVLKSPLLPAKQLTTSLEYSGAQCTSNKRDVGLKGPMVQQVGDANSTVELRQIRLDKNTTTQHDKQRKLQQHGHVNTGHIFAGESC